MNEEIRESQAHLVDLNSVPQFYRMRNGGFRPMHEEGAQR